MGLLYDKLTEYAGSDYYPLHMPGHKRNALTPALEPFAKTDITEIDGFDNLHAAEDILLCLQQKAAAIYGAEESFYLINGSSCGILAAISATGQAGKKLLMVRGCHKSAYHGLYLSGQEAVYLWPEVHPQFGCEMQITPKAVEKALEENADISAVLIVSPTYEGLHANIPEIAKIVHKRKLPLIVDAAHGAHLGFHEKWAENVCRQGADLVIMSLHKTLPSPTQTALMHVNGDFVDRKRLRRYLQIYQSSSPSYPMMAAMEEALDYTNQKKKEIFDQFYEYWQDMLHTLSGCQYISCLKENNSDIGKLVVRDTSGCYSGKELYDILRDEYHLQPEMATGDYMLAMFTIGDTKEGFIRTAKALLEIDRKCTVLVREKQHKTTRYPDTAVLQSMSLKDAWDAPKIKVSLKEAAGKISGEFVNLYPPGRPILVPGEKISTEIVSLIIQYIEENLTVHGIECRDGEIKISVLS